MTTTSFFIEQSQPSGSVLEQLRGAARAALSWDVLLRPATISTFPARVDAARRALAQLEEDMGAQAKQASTAPIDADLSELRRSPRLLRSVVAALFDRRRVIATLPRIVLAAHCEEPRIAMVATLYVRTVDGQFSPTTFNIFIQELQAHEPLTLDELWNLAEFLRFAMLEALLAEARAMLDSSQPAREASIQGRIKSLRSAADSDWPSLIEPLIAFDATLRQDPAETYAAMDFESREYYRKRVAFVARYSDCTESEVARAAVDLAQEAAQHPAEAPRVQRRRLHIGYYLRDKGFPQLAKLTGFHPRLADRARAFLRAQADFFYITGIQLITIFFITGLILFPLPHSSMLLCLIAAILLILPASQSAVDLLNNAVTAIFDPHPLPKLDFSRGIPAECATIVAVPTLLLNEKQVRKLVSDLEVRYLANRDPHLHFALLSDLPDSVTKPHENDSDPLVELAMRLISELNVKYAAPRQGSFLFLHRRRLFNSRQGVWMGWERKRGKLLDLNKLMAGEFDAFPIKSGYLPALSQIRYVLTLDSDSRLPRGSAARLIGAIAHPLNEAVIHPKLRIVTEGYGILQPRIGVTVQSASRSRLAAIYSGQSGFDIYTRAVSDVYQDLYDEGSFTGKGIYEAATLHAVLDHRFPRNSLLSHDLIEGAFARAGLATDVELIDDYPSHLSAYNRRKHRWVRGDWQIAQWMFSRVPDESGQRVPNPISEISRWKIFDNLRRSLVEPFTLILFVAGWLGLPGGPLYWTSVSVFLLILPTAVQFVFSVGRALANGRKGGISGALTAFWQGLFTALLNFVYLPYQTMLAFDAIVRVFVRQFITGERLLEWETAAQAESRSSKNNPADRYLALSPFVALALAVLVYLLHSASIAFALPIVLLWGSADVVTAWLNAPPRQEQKRLASSDKSFLLAHALRIWRYFHEFGGERHNYLIPDNVEEDGLFEAARVSPTNVGLLLNARQAACELGFLTVPEFVELTDQSLSTIAKLEKHRGHLYNWYDTQTLRALDGGAFVSSVDSGNLVASLYTLHAGALDLLKRPLAGSHLFTGLRPHWQMLPRHERQNPQLYELRLPGAHVTFAEWAAWLPAAVAALSAADDSGVNDRDAAWALSETAQRVTAILTLLRDYMPWLLAEYSPLRALPQCEIKEKADMLSIEEAIAYARTLQDHLDQQWIAISSNSSLQAAAQKLRASLSAATQNLHALSVHLRSIADRANQFAEEMEFGFLTDHSRQLLSIGYDMRAQKLHSSCYDLLASEARIATFLAIARCDLPQESWFKLGRDHALAFDQLPLLSWTGTMFEYLMPALWMRSYHNTLIAQAQAACVSVHRACARVVNTPWGISESGTSSKDDGGHYCYKAFGVPQMALSTEVTAGPVVSPYSTFLALGIDSPASLRNLRHMASAGWVGSYGFYEAADYTSTSGKPTLVREWMAHHQGMSLLAILNLLNQNVVQRWFHANPLVEANELLLHETPSQEAQIRSELGTLGSVRAVTSAAA